MEFDLIEKIHPSLLNQLTPNSFFSNLELVNYLTNLLEKDLRFLVGREDNVPVIVIPTWKEENCLTSVGHIDPYNVFDFCPIWYKNLPDEKVFVAIKKYGKNLNYSIKLDEISISTFPKLSKSSVIPYLNIEFNKFISAAQFIQNRKDRKEIRRKLKRITSSFEMKFIEKSESDVAFDSFIKFFLNSGNAGKQVFMDSKMGKFFEYLFKSKFVNLTEFRLNNKIVSVAVYFDYQGTRSLYNMSSDVDFYSYSPGLVHVYLLVEATIQNKYKAFCYLRGEQRYKYELGANSCMWNYKFNS